MRRSQKDAVSHFLDIEVMGDDDDGEDGEDEMGPGVSVPVLSFWTPAHGSIFRRVH